MSDDIDHTSPEDESRLLAAEYVLGVLPADEHRAVETRMALEPTLAREVAFWEERLGGMASYVKSVTPPARMWLRIEAALSAIPQSTARSPSIWDSLLFWRLFAVGSSALAAACLAGLVYFATLPPPPSRVPLMATLGAAKTGQPNFVAAISSDGSSLTIVPATLLTADKRSLELWLIPQGGQPQSLGLISPAQMVRMNVPRDLIERVGAGATLAVSLEPPGGSPTGQPTGDVVAAGPLTRL
jgi:anti-sigma-K factor RskA